MVRTVLDKPPFYIYVCKAERIQPQRTATFCIILLDCKGCFYKKSAPFILFSVATTTGKEMIKISHYQSVDLKPNVLKEKNYKKLCFVVKVI